MVNGYVAASLQEALELRAARDVVPYAGGTDLMVENRQGVEYLNNAQGVSKAQATAMKAGSLCGWATKAADPANYNDQGELQKQKHRDRGDAR